MNRLNFHHLIVYLFFYIPKACYLCAHFCQHVYFSLYLFCCVWVCLCSHWAEDRATGEIPLNYTQMVINYRWHFGRRNDFILKWGQPPLRSTMLVCVCNWVCVIVPSPVALLPAQQETHTHLHAYTHINMGCLVCVRWWIQQPHPAQRSALMNILIMLKSASCLGFPVPSGKVNSGWLYSTARTCGHTGAERLWRSVLTVLDVSGPKIDLGKQSKYHRNIKVPWRMPQNKQTLQLQQFSHWKVPNQMFSLTDLKSSD